MKNKGFTLIELLAVIVILAIIALIATPTILGIINDAKTNAQKRSAELAYAGVEYAITSYMFAKNGEQPTSVSDIQKYFTVENVELLDDGKIKEKGATKELCTVTADPTTKIFTVNCGTLMAEKKIFATK